MGFLKLRGIDISPADALVGDVKAPKTFFSVAAPIKTGTMPTVALAMGRNAYPQGYHVGDAIGLQHVEPNLQAAYITAGVNIFGVNGTQGLLNPYYPRTIFNVAASQVKSPDHSHPIAAPLPSEHKQNYLNDVANYIKRLTPAPLITDAEAIVVPDHSNNVNSPVTSQGAFQMLIDGAVADDGGVETDETAAARDATANDMTLLPAVPAVGDAYMLGCNYKAHRFRLNIGTAGAGNWTLQMKYWNGAWVACVDEVETSSQFQSSGLKYWQHTPQGDWALSVIQGMNLYWVRIEVVNYLNVVTQPLGTQSWWELFI